MARGGVLLVDVIIPCLNEEDAIGAVVSDLVDERIRHVYVSDNGSTDRSAERARNAGAIVVHEPRRGYGWACMKAMRVIEAGGDLPDAILFLDGDYSDFPEDASVLINALEDGADLVIGSRVLGDAQPGALLPQARFGNWLSTRLIKGLFGEAFTDLGPFRIVRWDHLMAMNLREMTYGWTVEMQVRAAQAGLRCAERSVRYRPRIGTSKVTGTVRGTVLAGVTILTVIAREAALARTSSRGAE